MLSGELSLFFALYEAMKNRSVPSDCGFTIQFDTREDLKVALDLLLGDTELRYSVNGLKLVVRGA